MVVPKGAMRIMIWAGGSIAAVAIVLAVLLVTGTAPFGDVSASGGRLNARSATPPPTASTSVPAGHSPSTPTPSRSARSTPTTSPPTGPVSVPKPSGDHPNAATTGVPPGTKLTDLGHGDYEVRQNGARLNAVHISGDLLIIAFNVVITNSQIDGQVLDEYADRHYSFTISDSTVGPTSGCQTLPGVGEANFTATRVHIRGHGDGFRASGDNINIQDSYVKLCSNPGDHSDGIQTYITGKGLVLNHTTIDQRDAHDVTAPVFITDPGAVDVTVTNNLVMGGTYSIQVKNAKGTVIVKNNDLVNHTWEYGPVEADCGSIQWSGNQLVTIDSNYRVTSVAGPLPCAT